MTQEQADQIIMYLETMNLVQVRISDYVLLIFFVLSLVGGIYIGQKMVKP